MACAIFLQDLDPCLAYTCLAYKASSGYLLSLVLNISNEKRQEVRELIELKNRPRSMSLIGDHVTQILPRGYICLALAHFFIFFLTSIQCVRFGFLYFFLFVSTSLFRRRVLCMQYSKSVLIHATHLLFPFSSDCATNWKSYPILISI